MGTWRQPTPGTLGRRTVSGWLADDRDELADERAELAGLRDSLGDQREHELMRCLDDKAGSAGGVAARRRWRRWRSRSIGSGWPRRRSGGPNWTGPRRWKPSTGWPPAGSVTRPGWSATTRWARWTRWPRWARWARWPRAVWKSGRG